MTEETEKAANKRRSKYRKDKNRFTLVWVISITLATFILINIII